MADPARLQPALNIISPQGVVLDKNGETPETETDQKNSNFIHTHAKCKYRNIIQPCHLMWI